VPERRKSYVGLQMKKSDINYSAASKNNSVQEVRNQAEEAFTKIIHDVEDHTDHRISRFIVVTLGKINDNARKFIQKTRERGADGRIDYWEGDVLATMIIEYWNAEFQSYFYETICTDTKEGNDQDLSIVDSDYIRNGYCKLTEKCRKAFSSLDARGRAVVRAVARIQFEQKRQRVKMATLLQELQKPESYFEETFRHLVELDYIDFEKEEGIHYISLGTESTCIHKLTEKIADELEDAGEPVDQAEEIMADILEN
jgi:hypothetical protein